MAATASAIEAEYDTQDERFMPVTAFPVTFTEDGPLGISLFMGKVDDEQAVKVKGWNDKYAGVLDTGSVILEINGTSTQGKGHDEVMELLRSPTRPMQVYFGDEDAYRELGNRFEYTWEASGPLGLKMCMGHSATVQITAINNQEAAEVVKPGMVVIEVGGESLQGVPYHKQIEMIKTDRRPLTLVFELPEKRPQGPAFALRRASFLAHNKVMRGQWTPKELNRLTVASVTVPFPFFSYGVKLLTGGRTPTFADPVFIALGLDNFWMAADGSSEGHVARLALEGPDLAKLLGNASLIDYVEHTYEEGAPLDLELKPMAVRHGKQVGAVLTGHKESTLEEGTVQSKVYDGMIVAEIEGDPVENKPFESILETLQSSPRPLTIKFADINKLKVALATITAVTP